MLVHYWYLSLLEKQQFYYLQGIYASFTMRNRTILTSAFLGFTVIFLLSTTSCSPKYGCPSVEQADLNKKAKKAKSGLSFPGDKKRKKRK